LAEARSLRTRHSLRYSQREFGGNRDSMVALLAVDRGIWVAGVMECSQGSLSRHFVSWRQRTCGACSLKKRATRSIRKRTELMFQVTTLDARETPRAIDHAKEARHKRRRQQAHNFLHGRAGIIRPGLAHGHSKDKQKRGAWPKTKRPGARHLPGGVRQFRPRRNGGVRLIGCVAHIGIR
jgi:hypothetical protein